MFFSVKMWKKTRKTQGALKNLEKSQEPQEEPKILGENPRSGNAECCLID